MIARLFLLAIVASGGACSRSVQPPVAAPAPTTPLVAYPTEPPPAPRVQLGEPPRMKQE